MRQLIEPEFVHVRLAAESYQEALQLMAQPLLQAGRVRPSFEAAVVERERQFPTGLPLNGGVAMPHTDPEHVVADAVSVATLSKPVTAGEMGGGVDSTVEVSCIFLLVFSDGAAHVKLLKTLVRSFQDTDFMAGLRELTSREEIAERVTERLTA
ncbi:PTS system IIA component (Gat family) [Luteococcus japonicus]|uniref:PTS system IIA component (Gat family) n=1 Tax=Luteococcus japonicus TaxID=33984 RepID=A0A3N1ZUG1_9ACTN|nr:PTS sugar transporter subunit IIA [Luteococcus japonicus]ROR54503.1 PTS system IIA component (Gat family) [Luteococcus japonicus]